jgi:coenzyme F420-0:L-glutamate ligase/coenzyme F420-1:gamma-L-glutamate ligase
VRQVTLTALEGIPEVTRGAPLARLLLDALERGRLELADGDIVVVAQKVVSKAEGRRVRLADVEPRPQARELATRTHKDPRLIELILRETREVLRARPGVLIVEHRLGFVMANAGVDRSNVGVADQESALLLPEDPDASARALRAGLLELTARSDGVDINDSFGRAWRNGVAGVAIGVAGLPALVDLRGRRDRDGRTLEVTQVALADELASAASLVMGQADEGAPAVLVRGLEYQAGGTGVRPLLRKRGEDLFR